MGIYYGVFYKDKDGYEILVQDEDRMLVFPNKAVASAQCAKYVEKVINILNPVIKYKKVRVSIFRSKMEMIEPPKLEDWVRQELVQKSRTCFVKQITA
ncbi:hypothetical protein Acj61p023 [Acinetobacter phage Acj61]|uniref:Uncharacterized protein n=1 Tax=Acinetobacter phage Acj61 TaxID=760732 RepID=E5E404_9CAUD|nr:hypothetical protein Acj61p023 [Acinetobacter phage Acj61]ADG35988.1 hypothetical protein Acj61p023 [Acinetobacter phage Acj61]